MTTLDKINAISYVIVKHFDDEFDLKLDADEFIDGLFDNIRYAIEDAEVDWQKIISQSETFSDYKFWLVLISKILPILQEK